MLRLDFQYRFPLLVAGLFAFFAATLGCGPATEIRLIQPRMSGWQRDMQLLSDQVYWVPGKDVDRVLAQFPLPGAATGRAAYLLYLRLPVGRGELVVAKGAPSAVCGFFIQTRGEYAGLVEILDGQVVVKGTSQSANATRKLIVDLRCEDDTRLVGHLLAKRDDWYMTEFETYHRPADVKALVGNLTTKPADQEE